MAIKHVAIYLLFKLIGRIYSICCLMIDELRFFRLGKSLKYSTMYTASQEPREGFA